MQAEGLVERVQGVGTSPRSCTASSTLRIRDLHEEIVERGHQHSARVVRLRAERAPVALAGRTGLEVRGERVPQLDRARRAGVPLQCEDRYVNPACAPHYLSVDFTRTTPTHYLFDTTVLWRAQFSIEAALPTAEEAALPASRPPTPASSSCAARSRSEAVITLARLVPGARYTLQGDFAP